jgi:CelD/BcsL family acetyltransferase involved in cellulose biosynthesis
VSGGLKSSGGQRLATLDGLEIETAKDFGSVRDEWETLAKQGANVFGTWTWCDCWRRHLAPKAELDVSLIRGPDHRPLALLPLYTARKFPQLLLRFMGAGPSDELGPICAPADREVAEVALRSHVEQAIGNRGVFVAEHFRSGHALSEPDGRLLRAVASPVLPVRGRSFDEYLAGRSRNFREQVRRRERKLAAAHRLSYRLCDDPERIDADMRTLISLHQARWGRGGSAAFAGARTEFHLDFARRALQAGWLRLWMLELDGRPAAAWYGLRFANVETFYQSGRDPALDHLGVGFVLLCHTIRSAFGDGVDEYRFGVGDEPYKGRFSEGEVRLETVAISAGAAGTLTARAIRYLLGLPPGARRLAQRLAS